MPLTTEAPRPLARGGGGNLPPYKAPNGGLWEVRVVHWARRSVWVGWRGQAEVRAKSERELYAKIRRAAPKGA